MRVTRANQFAIVRGSHRLEIAVFRRLDTLLTAIVLRIPSWLRRAR
jgi:hypothetical protein